MAATSRLRFRQTIGDDHRNVGIVATNWADAIVPGTITNASAVAPATRHINRAAHTL